MVKLLSDCPAQFIYDVKNPGDTTDAMVFGHLYHAVILEPWKFLQTYECIPEGLKGNTKAGVIAIEEIRARGREPIKFNDWMTLEGMASAIREHPVAGKLFARDGDHELSLFWRDPLTNVTCRARTDFMPANSRLIVDLKTAHDASQSGLSNSMVDYGYHLQASLYEEGAYSCDLRGPDAAFVFVSQQKDPPFIVSVWSPDEDAKKLGRRKITQARRIYAECLERDVWPAYIEGVGVVGLPRWARKELETQGD